METSTESVLTKSDYTHYFFSEWGLDVCEDYEDLNKKFGFEKFQIPLETAAKQAINSYGLWN